MKPTIMKSSFHKLPNSTPPPASRPPHNHMCSSGFTLIEILVVVVIIGILASIGFPQFSKWNNAYRTKGAAQALYADLQKAKSHAIKTNRTVTFKFDHVPDCSGPTGYTFTDKKGVVVAQQTWDDGICIFDQTTFNDDVSGFDSRGLQAEDPPILRTIKLKHADRSKVYEITLSIAGGVKIK